jgi:hypothetical protein
LLFFVWCTFASSGQNGEEWEQKCRTTENAKKKKMQMKKFEPMDSDGVAAS